MKKVKMIFCCLFLACLVCGCGNKKSVDVYADVSNASETISTNKGDSLTIGQVYSYLREQNESQITNNIMMKIMRDYLNFSDQDIVALYNKYLNEYFTTTFIDSGSYDYFEEFNEELVVNYLRSESYDIVCEGEITSSLSSPFTCDYSDYINKEVNYDIYVKMLKVKYIIDEKADLIDKNKGRRITYYTATKDGFTTLEELEKYINDISENYDSEDDSLVRSIADIAEIKRKEDLDDVNEDYQKLSINLGESSTSSNDSSFTYLSKFTNCGNLKCTIEEGREYQQNLILEKEYYTTVVINRSDTTVLYEAARDVLFSDNIDDYLYTIGTKKYLISPVHINDKTKDITDIILFESSTYYLVEVEVLDSTSSYADKVLLAELLLDKVSTNDLLEHLFEESNVEIYDKQVREYFVSTYGEYKDE